MIDFLLDTFGEVILLVGVGLIVSLLTLGWRKKDQSKKAYVAKNMEWLAWAGLILIGIFVGMCSGY